MNGTSPQKHTVNDALQSWKSAHDRLSGAIDVYLAACTTFESCCARSRLSFSENNSEFDSAVSTVHAELPRLEENKQSLENSLAILKRARNLSYALVPINVLPQSLLVYIFSMLIDSEYTSQIQLAGQNVPPHPAHTISRVCTSWRNMTFNTPSLWSSIFIHDHDLGDIGTQLSLLRASNALLDTRISFSRPLESYNWLYLLRPRVDQLRSLNLVLPGLEPLREIMDIWSQGSTAPALKTLSLKIKTTTFYTDRPNPKVLPDGAHERLFEGVTSLSLYGGYFDWDSAAFTHLVHLQLAGLARPGPSLGQIAHILSGSPGLETLSLGDMRIRAEEEVDRPSIRLHRLRKLSLMSFTEADLCKLVPLISPGPTPLTLHMSYEMVPGPTTETMIALFRRSHIESIYFYHRISRNTMAETFGALPNLQSLYISENKHMTKLLQALAAPKNNPGVPCPQLRTLHFDECKFNISDSFFGQPITTQPSLSVRFQRCSFLSLSLEDVQEHLVGLAAGQVVFESPPPEAPHEDCPFYGLTRNNEFVPTNRTQTGGSMIVVLMDE